MWNLGKSLEARYLQALGQDVRLPEDGYNGDYVTRMARRIVERAGDSYLSLSKDERLEKLAEIGEREILAGQKADLEAFGVRFDNWYSERSLYESRKVRETVQSLRDKGYAYEDNGALWLRSTAFGDEEDRALIRRNGQATYFAGDTAYHADKFDRGFQRLINIWGPQHDAYIARTKAAVEALGYAPDKLDIIIHQPVSLFSGGESASVSGRAGELIPLGDLVKEIGRDTSRFFLLTRSADTALDIDLELTKQQSFDNPFFCVQDACIKVFGILMDAADEGLSVPSAEDIDLSPLSHESEVSLVKKLSEYPGEIRRAAESCQPHLLTAYAVDIASKFQNFSRECQILGEDAATTNARLILVEATGTVLQNLLSTLGISVPREI
jgi:arginyl-tRNA synthetase